ncbi:hypothetical protein HOU08_gp067 [Dickeya phage vB_DsoM_JA29]|uniref:Uncharacterized protein n=1 Tax=Dickeya phage vB_DsoM_JA29 TaxID=2283031 RepID=A0A384ZX04_9CAUD|nr:hypothetical protein HOU08_gp067 [Dickeya phage vB_DsoM_JA29]AXG66793.1 hypothetical protein JA29_067 [Dickeya phage vB_DsoM_JA29]
MNIKRFIQRHFATWFCVDYMIVLSPNNVQAEITRHVRIGTKIFSFSDKNIIGQITRTQETVNWMRKGSFISGNSTMAKALTKEYQEFSQSSHKSFKSYRSAKLAQSLLDTLKISKPIMESK